MPKRSLSINDRFFHASDGTRIAYRVEGAGPSIVLTNGLTTTTTFWKYVRPIWLQRHTVLTWDLPGHGNSGPAQSDLSASVPGQPDILAQVMREVAMTRAAQIGWSTGAQVVLETYRQHPELCESLVMLLGGAGHVLDTMRMPVSAAAIEWFANGLPRGAFDVTHRVLSSAFRLPGSRVVGRLSGFIGPRVSRDDLHELTEHIASVHPYTLQRFVRSSQAHTAAEALAALRVPLLILGGDKDPFAPSELVAFELQRLAPQAELARLPEGTHTALLEEPEWIARTVQRFLDGALGLTSAPTTER
jgi:pimeloyl-ACP methyl ester carboxylesterase